MLKECCNCKTKITLSDFYKQYIKNRYRYTCSKCGAVHKAKISSIVVYTVIFLSLYMYLLLNDTFTLLMDIFILFIYILIFEPLILKYTLMSKKDK